MASVERISGKPCVRPYKCTSATPAFDEGDLVRLDGSGTLVIATDAAASATAGILGIALEDAPSNTSDYVNVDIISSDGSVFVMNSTETAALTQLGEQHAITFTKGAHTLTSGSGYCVAIGYPVAIGTTTPKIEVKFVHEALQSEVGW